MNDRRTIRVLLFLSVVGPCALTCHAEEPFRMPVYSTEAHVPPVRSRDEVERVLAGADAAAAAEDQKAGPLRIVLVAGPKDHDAGEHDYPAWQKVWSRLLARAPNTTVDTAWEFPSQEQIDNADVLVFFQRGRWDNERAAAIDPFLARGGGAVYVHWAVDGRGGQEEFARRIGLASLGGSIKYRHGAMDIDLRPGAGHPITRNIDRIELEDEAYWELTGDPSRLNLLGTSIEDGVLQPIFWTIEHGPGRVFVSIPGHYSWTFDDPLFRTLLLRGIAWTGHRNVDRFNELVTLDARVE
jgi:type 1 glutamine amidotransferase